VQFKQIESKLIVLNSKKDKTKEDLELAREIYKHLYVPGKIFYTQEIIDLLDRHPEIAKINAHVAQKSLKA